MGGCRLTGQLEVEYKPSPLAVQSAGSQPKIIASKLTTEQSFNIILTKTQLE
jgi:hypothetical protein